MHDIHSGTIQRLAAPIVTQECWLALDHLRNALDNVPAHSEQAETLATLIRKLAIFTDSTLG